MSNEFSVVSESSPKSVRVLTFKVPTWLAERVDSYAAMRGMTRNQAGAQLLTAALSPPSGGYNPQTGKFS